MKQLSNKNYKLKLSTSLLICLIIVTISEAHFLLITNLNKSTVVFIERLFTVIAFFMIYSKVKINHKNFGFLYTYFLTIIIFLLSQYLYTIAMYGNAALRNFVTAANSYLWTLLMFPIYYISQREKGIRKILDILSTIVVIALGIIIIYAVLYNNFNRDLFSVEKFYTLIRRNNRLRLWDLSSLEGFVSLWLFYNILYFNNKTKYIIGLAIIMVALFYVEQTRMMQIAIFLCMAIMFITKNVKHRYVLLSKIIIIILVIFGIFFSGYLENLINSFSTTGDFKTSTLIRIDEVSYSLELIKENPITGTGLLTESVTNLNDNYEGQGIFTYTDIGLLGYIAQTGIGSIFIYIFPLIRFFYILFKTKKNEVEEPYPYLFSVFVFLVITSGTLIVMNPKRMYAWPFCLAFFEYWFSSCKKLPV